MSIPVIDLFAGAGGMGIGAIKAGVICGCQLKLTNSLARL